MNAFIKWLGSPLSEYHLASLQHKLLSAAVGGGIAYLLYQRKLPTWQIVLYSLAAAYGTSAILHAASRFEPTIPPPSLQPMQPAQQMPPQTEQIPISPQEVEYKETEEFFEDDDSDLEGIWAT